MKKTDQKQIFKNKYFGVIAFCILVGLIVTCVIFFKDAGRKAAVSSIRLSFEGAADGRTPDGEAFDISALTGDEILDAALTECDLKEKYTADQLRSSLYIRGDYPEDIADEILSFESLFDYEASKPFTHDGYHATHYTIALYNDFDQKISKEQLDRLLTAILNNYTNTFKSQYGKIWNADLLELDLENYDYVQQLTILKDQLDQAAGFAEELYEQEPGVITGGESFNDICIRMRNISENDIPRLQAMVVMGGLSRDSERLLIQYEYEIGDLCIQLKYQNDRLKEVENLLNSYEKNDILYISSGEELTKIDGNSSETYDELVEEKKEIADGITDIKSNISKRLMSMQDILGDEAQYSDYFVNVNAILMEQMETEEYEQLLDDTGIENQETTEEPEIITAEPAEENEADKQDVEETDTEELPAENTEASVKKEDDLLGGEPAEGIHKGREIDSAEIAALESEIRSLEGKIAAIETDFNNMLVAYNELQLNDATITIAETQLVSKKLISGVFIKTGIKCAGPFVSIGIMICVVMVLLDMKKKEKKAKA